MICASIIVLHHILVFWKALKILGLSEHLVLLLIIVLVIWKCGCRVPGICGGFFLFLFFCVLVVGFFGYWGFFKYMFFNYLL